MHEVGDAERMPAAFNDEPSRRVIPLLRSFTVFNVAQVADLPEALAALPLHAE